MAEAIAQRFTQPGIPAADTTRAAANALTHAVDRAGPIFAGRMTSYLVDAMTTELLMHGAGPMPQPLPPRRAPQQPSWRTPPAAA